MFVKKVKSAEKVINHHIDMKHPKKSTLQKHKHKWPTIYY